MQNRTVVIVGASSGIGLATARLAASRGASVVLLSRSQTKLDAALATMPEVLAGGLPTDAARAVAMDMLDRKSVDRVFGAIDGVDHLVLTAVADELKSRASIRELTEDQLERSLDKLRGFVNVVRAAVPRLRERASITLVTGASAIKPAREGFSALAAASASILGLGKALALELAPVRVNVVMSGVVDTPIHAEHRDQIRAFAEKELLVQRFGQPEDLAHAIHFLIENPYVTAHTLTVDGGLTAI